jgi:PTH1 family peptidyl-tRNA hydrolase
MRQDSPELREVFEKKRSELHSENNTREELSRPFLAVGLGNPGASYENTYHNAGRILLESVAAIFSGSNALTWKTYKRIFTYAQSGELIFVEPMTFMNESGRAVREAVRKFNVSPEDVIIFHDDSDLPLGTWKISRERGAAGHHGVESIIAALGVNSFTRVRVGIRPKEEHGRKKAEEFVLKPITKTARALLDSISEDIARKLMER